MPQSFGQQLLHTERTSSNQQIQELKEQTAQLIDELHFQKEQTSNVNVKRWIGKSILYFENATYYAEQALSVPQPQQEISTNGGTQHRSQSRRVQPQMQS